MNHNYLQILHLKLFIKILNLIVGRGELDDGRALNPSRGHQGIPRRGIARLIENNFGRSKFFGTNLVDVFGGGDIHTQLLQGVEVGSDRPLP